MNTKWILITLCLFLLSIAGYAQEAEKEIAGDEPAFKTHHRITLMMANAHVPSIAEDIEGKKNLILPAWGLDYDYWFTNKWAVGLHNNMILQHFAVEEEEEPNGVLEVSYPLTVSLVALYMPVRNLTFIAGFGREFEKTENLSLLDFGLEYGFELPDEWELSLNLKYEDKLNAYDSWLFGFGISKIFGRR
ncbi:MAG: hypothetical protein IPL92_01245 [Saprospiraceae bacterium]|nr:hypothetical protein [Candidatus Opimibacter iunctus]